MLKLPPVITITTPRPYSSRYLSEDERVRLADLRLAEHTIRDIGRLMGRAASTISRELRRGADARGRYHPFDAQRRAVARRRIQRSSRLATDVVLREWVAGRLMARWSPETIAVALRREFLASRSGGYAPRRSIRPCTGPIWAACRGNYLDGCCDAVAVIGFLAGMRNGAAVVR